MEAQTTQTKFYHSNFEKQSIEPDLDEFVAFRLSETMLEQLKQKAGLEGSDLSSVIRKVLRGYLE